MFLSMYYIHVLLYNVSIIFNQENRFAKCKDCTEYKRELQSTMEKIKKQNIRKLLDEHLKLVM